MNERSIQEQIVKYLADIHSIEQQALVQMKIAPKIAGDATLEAAFEKHIGETEDQKRRVDERLEALGGSPSKVKDVAGAATAPAFALFARLQPDTPGKLVSHAFSYEHMELAAYELLSRIAQRANDQQTVELAKQIAAQESVMARRLSDNWDVAVTASLRDKDPDNLGEQLNKYLSDAHAIESQAEQMLTKAIDIGGDPKLSQDYEEHLEQTRHHKSLIEERLEARGGSPNFLKDAAMKLGALNWGTFFAAQPDTPAKLAGFAYAFEHLEIASYEQLRRVAERAGDESVAGVAQTILPEERHAAETLWDGFDRAIDASLESVGVAS
jgi:ferritin-like metal-binding protein YciE